MTITNMNLIVLFFFFFFILLLLTFYKKYLTYRGICVISIINNAFFFYHIIQGWSKYVVNQEKESFTLNISNNNWTGMGFTLNLELDQASFTFLTLVSFIGFLTNIYILSYFKHEQRGEEFTVLVNWFIFSMMWFLLGDNYVSIMLGWEGIGLTSFLLINFWVEKTLTLNSSMKAFVFNKISDIFLLIAFVIFWHVYQTDNISSIRDISCSPENIQTLQIGCVMLIFGCFIKSAQFIFHLWLPDSMEAPVPASALIHSATLVSAGIYLIVKFYFIILICNLEPLLFIWGSLTAFYGGFLAAMQTDLKKILAYSTISHCGFLVVSITFGNWLITFVYLFLHGIYKASVFFCSGFFIKYFSSQDNRLMGKTKGVLVLKVLFIFTVINLSGLPFTWGYLYKYLFFIQVISTHHNIFFASFLIFGMLTSLVYCFKLIKFTLFDIKNNNNSLELLLQNNSFKKNKYNNFLKSILICIFFVFIFSFFFYFFVTNFLIPISLQFNYNPTPSLKIKFIFLKLGVKYLMYYFCFLILLFFLVVLVCRVSVNKKIPYIFFEIACYFVVAKLCFKIFLFF